MCYCMLLVVNVNKLLIVNFLKRSLNDLSISSKLCLLFPTLFGNE